MAVLRSLKCLQDLDRLYIEERDVEGWYEEGLKYYCVRDWGGRLLFKIEEEVTESYANMSEFRVKNPQNHFVFKLHRPFITERMEVRTPEGDIIGCVEQEKRNTAFGFNFVLLDRWGDIAFNIKSEDDGFKLWTRCESFKVASIRRKFPGNLDEVFSNLDKFEIFFPANWDVAIKATVLAACVLLESMRAFSSSETSRAELQPLMFDQDKKSMLSFQERNSGSGDSLEVNEGRERSKSYAGRSNDQEYLFEKRYSSF